MQRTISFLYSWHERGKCIQFPGLTKEECPLPTLVFEIKGLGLGQDLKPNNNVIGYFIFSQKKRMLMLVV